MEKYITRKELEMLINETKSSIKRLENQLKTKTETSDALIAAEKFLIKVKNNPNRFSKKELRKIVEISLKIGEIGRLILEKTTKEMKDE